MTQIFVNSKMSNFQINGPAAAAWSSFKIQLDSSCYFFSRSSQSMYPPA